MNTGDWDGGRHVKAGGDNAECQVCEEVRTAQTVFGNMDISNVDMDAECMGGGDLAHVEIICLEN